MQEHEAGNRSDKKGEPDFTGIRSLGKSASSHRPVSANAKGLLGMVGIASLSQSVMEPPWEKGKGQSWRGFSPRHAKIRQAPVGLDVNV